MTAMRIGLLARGALGAAALMAALVLAAPAGAGAQAPAAIASATLEPGTATVGDRLTLTVVVEHEPGTVVEGPGFGAPFGGLELVELAPPRTSGGRTTLAYTLTSFAVGTYTVPPLAVAYRAPGGASGTLETPALAVTIASVLRPGDDELRPLKPQLDIPEPAPPAAVPVLFVAVFAALTFFGYLLVARAIAVRPAPVRAYRAAPPAALPPDARARAELDALAAAGASDPGAYYARIAAIVRRYLSDRFDFAAYAMTRTEIERAMAGAGIDRWPARLAANLLEQCDAVQFAGFHPAAPRAEADLTSAYEIVELTSPRPAAEPAAPDADAGEG